MKKVWKSILWIVLFFLCVRVEIDSSVAMATEVQMPTPRILLLANPTNAAAGIRYRSPYISAVESLGLDYQLYTNLESLARAVSTVDAKTSIVILDFAVGSHPINSAALDAPCDEILDFVSRGGRAILGPSHTYILQHLPQVHWSDAMVSGEGEGSSHPLLIYPLGDLSLFRGGIGLVVDRAAFTANITLSAPALGAASFSFLSRPADPVALGLTLGRKVIVHAFQARAVVPQSDMFRLAVNEISYLLNTSLDASPVIVADPPSQSVPGGASVRWAVGVDKVSFNIEGFTRTLDKNFFSKAQCVLNRQRLDFYQWHAVSPAAGANDRSLGMHVPITALHP